jgi:hypothetical protein
MDKLIFRNFIWFLELLTDKVIALRVSFTKNISKIFPVIFSDLSESGSFFREWCCGGRKKGDICTPNQHERCWGKKERKSKKAV